MAKIFLHGHSDMSCPEGLWPERQTWIAEKEDDETRTTVVG